MATVPVRLMCANDSSRSNHHMNRPESIGPVELLFPARQSKLAQRP